MPLNLNYNPKIHHPIADQIQGDQSLILSNIN